MPTQLLANCDGISRVAAFRAVLFGGFWQNIERGARLRGVRIDGQPVVSLDYSQSNPLLAYGLIGSQPSQGDAYIRSGIDCLFSGKRFMHDISLRPCTGDDAAFALHLTEVCMRVYAEQTWGSWDGRADFNVAFDEMVQLGKRDIGLMGVERRPQAWFLDKLYLLPAYQRQGIGGYLLDRLIENVKSSGAELMLTVLEVNPARRFYERHGFVLTETISPRHHMVWRGR